MPVVMPSLDVIIVFKALNEKLGLSCMFLAVTDAVESRVHMLPSSYEMLLFLGLQPLINKIANGYNQQPISLSISRLFVLCMENLHEWIYATLNWLLVA